MTDPPVKGSTLGCQGKRRYPPSRHSASIVEGPVTWMLNCAGVAGAGQKACIERMVKPNHNHRLCLGRQVDVASC